MLLDQTVEGQFDDAEVPKANFLDYASFYDPREGRTFIDDQSLEWSEPGEDSDLEDVAEHDRDEEWDVSNANVDHEDWELADRGNCLIIFKCGAFIIFFIQISPSNITAFVNTSLFEMPKQAKHMILKKSKPHLFQPSTDLESGRPTTTLATKQGIN